MSPMLSIEHVEVRYGPVPAIRDLTMHVDQGEIVTLLGANGAGKTTTLRMISGLHKPFNGNVVLGDVDITTKSAHQLVDLGLSHVPEGRRIFGTMSVIENLEMGAFRRQGNFSDDFDHIFTLFPILGERRKQLGGTLSGGEQQMLAIGRDSWPSRNCCSWMSRRWVSPRKSLKRSFRSSYKSVVRVSRFSWWSRTRTRRFALPTAVTFWKTSVLYEDEASALLSDDRIRRAYLGSE